ncbi:general secretion pathway protein GspE [Spirochaetia bacterium]|nr:general secretion pathway protein GspE [Spirochaetia bacterium]
MTAISLSPVFCAANGIVINSSDDKNISLGMLHPEDTVLQARIKKEYPQYQCGFTAITTEEFNIKLSRLYGEENPGGTPAAANEDRRASAIDKIAKDAPAVNTLNGIFLEALAKNASDIHIEAEKENAQIRFRIDGMLVFIRTITQERALEVSARLKYLARLNTIENRRPQDGHLALQTSDYSLDARISIIPAIWGESIVLRLLNRSDVPLSVEALGFSAGHQEHIKTILSMTSGLILVTGPTGSGKTTTLAAVLKELHTSAIKIISIEDPVEYRIDGITQIQVNEELSLTFDAALRRIFRQDPDIIMVGEIRDIETAELAIRAAMTGHLVFATLHTNNASESVFRLHNMGLPFYEIAAVLKAVIAQRLIRKRCTACNAAGCPACVGTGYSGRTVIAEILLITTTLADSISRGILAEDMRHTLAQSGHRTLYDDAEEKVSRGITTGKEVQRELGAPQ